MIRRHRDSKIDARIELVISDLVSLPSLLPSRLAPFVVLVVVPGGRVHSPRFHFPPQLIDDGSVAILHCLSELLPSEI